jgi:hypothetical protein
MRRGQLGRGQLRAAPRLAARAEVSVHFPRNIVSVDISIK